MEEKKLDCVIAVIISMQYLLNSPGSRFDDIRKYFQDMPQEKMEEFVEDIEKGIDSIKRHLGLQERE